MPINFETQTDDVLIFRVSEELKLAEFLEAQNQIEEVINKIGNVKILIITENFQGWERAEGWEDFSFQDRNDAFIDKMAIVGDLKWKDSIFAFAAKGLRPVSIEYFEPDQEANARNWLKQK